MKKLLLQTLFLLVATLFIACGTNSSDSIITHRPFKVDKNDRWGMIGVDGKVLFENEFENEPSCVINGMFFARNSEGLYEVFTAESKPKKVGSNYLSCSYFIEDVAPVVEPEKHITFIKKDGSVAFSLDKYKGQEITSCTNFSDGLASFRTADGKHGFVNTSGVIVIPPRYEQIDGGFNNGLAVVTEGDTMAKTFVINKKGEKQFDLKVGESTADENGDALCVHNGYINGYLAIHRGDRYYCDHLLNNKGEVVYKAKENISLRLPVVNDKMLINGSDDELGLINIEGETLIRPKYESRHHNAFLAKDYIIVEDRKKKGVIDLEDNILVPFEFDEILEFHSDIAFAKDRGEWYLINKKGEQVDKKQAFAEIGGIDEEFDNVIRSDYFDSAQYVDQLMGYYDKAKHSYFDVTIGMTPIDIPKRWNISENIERLRGKSFFRLNVNESDSFFHIGMIPYFNESVLNFEDYNFYTEEYKYKLNPDARIHSIVVEASLSSYDSENFNLRIHSALIQWMKNNNWTLDSERYWNGDQWSIYSTNNSNYLIGIANESYQSIKISITSAT